VGRNRQSADAVIANMKKLNSAGTYEFVQGDLTLMKTVRSVAEEISTKVDKINYLCMSQGILSLKVHDDTEEGIDRKMALHYYSRWNSACTLLIGRFALANLLLPKLQLAAEQSEEARVLSVLAAGQNGLIDTDDLGLKKNTGLKRKADSGTAYNDLMIEVLIFFLSLSNACSRNLQSDIQTCRSAMPILVSSIPTSRIHFQPTSAFRTLAFYHWFNC
jgi:NAD(P)-dependent dehydrogenase (short-subunit alcohol dehydrogenase family)